ncbi:hypothetical protein BDV26DRAFT_286079 [Aspergillus bertholletiae]|uniref:FAD linked oxidase N-terminal domain-containing protein n=1 Tax=Aspergillus bertholletiae TaxID=1226010 RepID=A0A5N7AR00_9EURO|nr:hypothetical protein BDV26DRAFT_286079 [Aspergillus bertholletiae]
MANEQVSSGNVQDVLAILEPLIVQLDPADVFTPTSSLDFNVRGQCFRSPSFRDVLVRLLKFKSFEYDSDKKLATVGVGATWVEVAQVCEMLIYSLVVLPVARTPSVGVGGSIIHGGYSWMTGELGCISDSINFVNAEVVKYDGTVVMAADGLDLLWALRGSGGSFSSHRSSSPLLTDIWSGMILVPRHDLHAIARQIVRFISTPQHPRVNFLMYSVQRQLLHAILDESDLHSVNGDMIALHVYDACGESHGRAAFAWALEIPGAIDRTIVADTKGIVDMQQNVTSLRGTFKSFDAIPMATAQVDEETILRAMEWQDKIKAIDKDIHGRTMVLFEFLVLAEVAWPRRLDDKHYILIITGCPADETAEQERTALKIAVNAPGEVFGEFEHYSILPAGISEFHDPKKAYGTHWERLVKLRKKYDPELKFKAIINP